MRRNLYSYFYHLKRFKEDGEIKYYKPIGELVTPDRSTLEVSFDDIEKYNQNLATTIIEEYYRLVFHLFKRVQRNLITN